jgi:hypothetical protein
VLEATVLRLDCPASGVELLPALRLIRDGRARVVHQSDGTDVLVIQEY